MKEHHIPEIVDREEWNRLREELLLREKAHTKAGDELAAARRRMPMTSVPELFVEDASGQVALKQVFADSSTLVVYHFMWKCGAPHHMQCEGCTHSQIAMTSAVQEYLLDRGVRYVVFSSGPIDELLAYLLYSYR